MNKIYQTIVSNKNGNCMQAALATMFSIKLDEAINVWDYGETKWALELIDWLESIGYEYLDAVGYGGAEKEFLYEKLNESLCVNDCLFASVPSKTFIGSDHAVLINKFGVVVHDPNPNELYLGVNVIESGDLQYFFSLSKIDCGETNA